MKNVEATMMKEGELKGLPVKIGLVGSLQNRPDRFYKF
jgi:hypothetical protein